MNAAGCLGSCGCRAAVVTPDVAAPVDTFCGSLRPFVPYRSLCLALELHALQIFPSQIRASRLNLRVWCVTNP